MDERSRKKYLLVSNMSRYKKRLVEAKDAIQQAVDTCNVPAVSFSFGKDSLVCVDIARQIDPDILILNIDRGEGGDIHEAVDMYDAYARKYDLAYYRVKTPRSVMQIYRDAGGIDEVDKMEITTNLMRGFAIANTRFEIDCSIMGLRTEESTGRSHLRKYGTFHRAKTGKMPYKCKPVLNWTGSEIWAYIVSNNLPYISFYDREARFEGYERARYSNWAGSSFKEWGRFARLKYTMPELYNKFASEFPEVREWS